MVDFKSLLANSQQKKETVEETVPEKPNPFANLAKTTAKATAALPSIGNLPKTNEEMPEPVATTPEISADEFNTPDQPDGLDPNAVKELKDCIETLQQSFVHREMIGGAIRNVLMHLQKYPFLKDILLPEDCQLMVRGLRESYGVQVVTKQKRGEKKAASAKEVDEVASLLSDIGFS